MASVAVSVILSFNASDVIIFFSVLFINLMIRCCRNGGYRIRLLSVGIQLITIYFDV